MTKVVEIKIETSISLKTGMAYPGSRSTGRIYDSTGRIFNPYPFGGLPTLGDVIGYPGEGRDTETYEECQARQDPNRMYIADPCRGKPSGGFKLPDLPRSPFPRSERPSSPIPGTFGVPQPGSVRVPPAGFPMAGFPSYRLEDQIRRGNYEGAAGTLVGGVLGSVLGNIIAGRGPLDFMGKGQKGKGKEDKPKVMPMPDKGESGEYEVQSGAVPLEVIPHEAPLQQNQEVMGPKAQVFPRFADPGDGTLSTTPMMTAVDPGSILFIEKSPRRVREINRRVIPGYDRVREKIQTALKGMA